MSPIRPWFLDLLPGRLAALHTSFPGFRHPAIRPSEPAPNMFPKQGSFASLSPPLLIKPGCLFDEFLDCRLRQFQDGCAEAITQKIKPSLDLADKRFVLMLFEAPGG
jgi:hypothetical protein